MMLLLKGVIGLLVLGAMGVLAGCGVRVDPAVSSAWPGAAAVVQVAAPQVQSQAPGPGLRLPPDAEAKCRAEGGCTLYTRQALETLLDGVALRAYEEGVRDAAREISHKCRGGAAGV